MRNGLETLVKRQPKIAVGITDRQTEITGRLDGHFLGGAFSLGSGRFSAKATEGMVVLSNGADRRVSCSPTVRLTAQEGSTFSLFGVTVGNQFHWEKKEDQTFHGNLVLHPRDDGTIVAINEILLEDYLASVISSEMSATAPAEFLKAHAILSRSWLLAALGRRRQPRGIAKTAKNIGGKAAEVVRWYDREEHDLFDVCSDDHCQRYHGISKILSGQAKEAVRETCGRVIAYQGEICDARYSKCCGGITEEFGTAWADRRVPYLESISDTPVPHQPTETEKEDALHWFEPLPDAYCNSQDEGLLKGILPNLDLRTADFFRWSVEYSRPELEEILKEKSGFDFGTLRGIMPLHRGPSGRISRLFIIGSKKSMVVGKELEIRRWLSRSHLYSSAFIVTVKHDPQGRIERFVFRGAGWGHGVGLCQIGAAVMAARGFSSEEILKHYFRGTEIQKVY